MISAVFMKITGLFTASSKALLLSARMVSVLLGVGTVWCTIRISKKLFAKLQYETDSTSSICHFNKYAVYGRSKICIHL